MKNFKKISLGAILASLVLVVLMSIGYGKTYAADPFNLGYISSNNQIGGSYKGNDFIFGLDSPAASSPWTFGIASNGPICEGSEITNINPSNLGKKTVTGKATNFRYMANGSTCTSPSQGTSYTGNLTIAASTNGGSGLGGGGGGAVNSKPINWNGAKGVLDSTGASLKVTFSDGTALNLTDNNPGDSTINFKPKTPGKYGGVVVASWCSNTLLPTSGGDPSYGISLSSFSASTGTVKVCYTSDNAQKSITQSGITIPVDTSAYTKAQQTGNTSPSCESNFDSPLAWIICPSLSLADSAAGAFNGFVEDQLCFKTTNQSTSTTGSNVVCNGNNNLDNNVHNAWSIFKNIASALLVIVMLIVVFSQAIGGGAVDAYTARKMLPKLVAAVIIMQLSWILLKFAIDLSNDFGRSIAALMEAPFGGIDKLTLKSMVGVDLSAHGAGTNNIVFFSALAAGAVGAIALSIPGLAMLALYAVLALLTAFIVLLFRKLLIILLVILSPIALILWILPGTERYWKMWWDNFLKLIAMFPLIMAIIAAGRIFADITAGNSAVMFNIHLAVAHLGPLTVPYIASFSNFADLAIIIGAFFGPYFLLPQTFKWGGAAMGAISQGVKQGMEKGAKPAKDYLGWRRENTRFALARKQRKALQEQRFKRNYAETLQQQGGPGIRGTLRGLRGSYERAKLLGVGSIGGEQEIIERASRSAEAEVAKAEREEDEFAMLRMQQEIDRTAPQNHDALMRARALGQTQYEERDIDGNRTGRMIDIGETSLRDQIAASRKLLTLGGTGNLQAYEQAYDRALRGPDGGEGSERLELFKRGIGAEIGTISPQLPHIIKGINAAVDQLNEDSFASLSGAEMQTLLGSLSQQIAAGGPGAAEAQRRLENLTAKFQSALHTQGKVINTGAAEAMSSFLDIEGGQPGLTRINTDRGAPGTPSIIGSESRRVDAAARRDIVDTLAARGIRPT